MKLKLNQQGFAVVLDGKPVYVHKDGREEAFDAAGTVAALNRRHFETSQFVAQRLSVPVDIALAAFSDRFKVEGGKLVGYDLNGVMIYSHTRHGEPANFEEAIEQLVQHYPDKEMILKGTGALDGSATQNRSGGQQKQSGNLGGTRDERTAVLASRFPELN